MKTVFDDTRIDSFGQPMFCGKPLGLQRFDRVTQPELLDLFKRQMDFFWRPERIDLTKDRTDFQDLTPAEKHLFCSNIQYQTAMDTVIARGLDLLVPHISLTELEVCVKYWAFCEGLHSYSYTYLLQSATPDAGAIFDASLSNVEIIKRGAAVKHEYDQLMRFTAGDVKKQILMALVSTQILEGVRFYISFACTFALAEPPHAKMEGNAKIVREICRDENVHVDITTFILNQLRTDPKEGFIETWKECEPLMIEMFRNAVLEEEAWAEYLFPDGPIVSLDADRLSRFVRFVAGIRMEKMGLKSLFPNDTENPLPWMSKWLNGNLLQVAPQETEAEAYKVLASDPVDADDFADLDVSSD